MSDKTCGIIWMYAISAAIAVGEYGFYVYGGHTFQGRDANDPVGAMMALGAIGGGLCAASTLMLIHSLWEQRSAISTYMTQILGKLGTFSAFIGKVCFGVWGVIMTLAVAFLFYIHFVQQ